MSEPAAEPELYVDLELALETLDKLRTEIEALDGTPIPPRSRGKSRNSELADITKRLSFIDHLARRLGVEVMSEFYVVRGRTDQ